MNTYRPTQTNISFVSSVVGTHKLKKSFKLILRISQFEVCKAATALDNSENIKQRERAV